MSDVSGSDTLGRCYLYNLYTIPVRSNVESEESFWDFTWLKDSQILTLECFDCGSLY